MVYGDVEDMGDMKVADFEGSGSSAAAYSMVKPAPLKFVSYPWSNLPH